MASGKERHSPIIDAIAEAEQGTTGEIRVHLSRNQFERDSFRHAQRIFYQFEMFRTTHRNAILIYVNLRKRRFAILGDQGIHDKTGQKFWEKLARELSQDLRSTHPEKAIALTVLKAGECLRTQFPVEPEKEPRMG